ncbi:hypothetical protein BCR36DRAFT_414607 [Piromyces finnis]|uniref:Dynein regulatory complex protein 10 n=1 Tax=Piromyces finnis TaxID=1754191 RepID=A0A1Y1V1Q5_9FUNG|nr:hypothetical protein BCR36DRAFT_414607 [Piromyces finnis]|eukprot:ORX45144.1 hypothetical protein BCR36DRAFT_414607 [Piromyces finnis]
MMNSVMKNDFFGNLSSNQNQLPPINQNNERKKILNQHSKELSFSELMISESDRSPCYIQRQRIKSVLNELYKKIVIVGLLPDSAEKHFLNIFDSNVSNVIKKYFETKNEYLLVRKSNGETNSLYLNEVTKRFKIAIKNVYRAFLFSPDAYLRLMKYQTESKIKKEVEIQSFEKTVTEILNYLYDMLDTTYEQDIKKQKEIKEITEIELKKKEKVEKYQSILKNAINERYENISEKTRQMEQYKDELEKCKIASSSNIKRIQNSSKQIIDREKKLSSDKKRQINTEIDLLTQKLKEKIILNKEEENNFLKKKFRIESEIENWIHKYDDEVSRKEEEIESLTKKYDEQHTALVELKEKYFNLKEEFRKEKEIRELKRIQEEERTFKIVQTKHAVLVIIRFYKAYLKRKQAKKFLIFYNS